MPTPPILYFMARILLYSYAILIGFLFMRLIFYKPILAKYGRYTLSIFMYHIFIVTALRPLFSNNILPCHEILLFFYAIILCFSLTWLTQHFKLMTIMLNPITYIINNFIPSKRWRIYLNWSYLAKRRRELSFSPHYYGSYAFLCISHCVSNSLVIMSWWDTTVIFISEKEGTPNWCWTKFSHGIYAIHCMWWSIILFCWLTLYYPQHYIGPSLLYSHPLSWLAAIS